MSSLCEGLRLGYSKTVIYLILSHVPSTKSKEPLDGKPLLASVWKRLKKYHHESRSRKWHCRNFYAEFVNKILLNNLRSGGIHSTDAEHLCHFSLQDEIYYRNKGRNDTGF